jgi:hypothetical protein
MGNVFRAKLKVFQGSESKGNVNGGVVNKGSKSLLEIKARTLWVALGNQPGLVTTVQGAISIVLDLHEPSGANCTLPRGQWDNLPSAIEPVSLHLFLTRTSS